MKKAGIVCDNYKVAKFKKELTAHGFTDFEVKPFIKNSSTIQVNVSEDKLMDLKKLCQNVELHFKRSN